MRRMYSKKELKDIIKANLENGSLDIKAKTIKQSDYNYSRTFQIQAPTGVSIQNIYNVFAEINSILHVIVNISLTNNTENTITIGQGYAFIGFQSLAISKEIAEKIFDIDGKTVHEVGTANTLICSEPCHIFTGKVLGDSSTFYQGRLSLVNRAAEDSLGVQISLNGGTGNRITLEPGASLYVTARMTLTLI